MTIYPKSFGINSLFFASKNLGVAVGALQSAGITTPGTVGYPNILMTIDQGVTWMSVTGGPAVTSTAAVSAVPSTSAPYPVQTPQPLSLTGQPEPSAPAPLQRPPPGCLWWRSR